MRTTIGIIALAAGALLATAGAANASPHTVTQATMHVTDRPDGGNGGTWADDSFTRTITITRTGGGPGAYTYTATLADKGTFTTVMGALTPNQGAPYAGDVIKSKVTGTMSGYADFSFTASSLPSAGFNAGVPFTENDHGTAPSDSTSTWYELAFPSGTVFGGAGIGPWSWSYGVTVITTTTETVCATAHLCWSVPVTHPVHEQWVDAWNNGDGNQPGDGNVTG